VRIDLFNGAHKTGKRAMGNPHRLASLESKLRFWFFGRDCNVMNDLIDLFRSERCRFLTSDKTRDFGCAFDQMPGFVGNLALIIALDFDEHIAWKKHPRAFDPFRSAHFHNRLGRNQYLRNLVDHAKCFDACAQTVAHLTFITRVGMNDKPLLRYFASIELALPKEFEIQTRRGLYEDLSRNPFDSMNQICQCDIRTEQEKCEEEDRDHNNDCRVKHFCAR